MHFYVTFFQFHTGIVQFHSKWTAMSANTDRESGVQAGSKPVFSESPA